MSDLSTFHLQRMERINAVFFESGDGVAATRIRSQTVDQIVAGYVDQQFPAAERDGFAALAVGGYGRSQLFPFSDVDLLFLFRREGDARRAKEPLSRLLTRLWDAQLRVSQSVRTPSECARLAPDNSELHISLLDVRFLAGDAALYEEFAHRTLPSFFTRERRSLLRSLIELAERRHKQFGRTIYHLEPDVKEGPGGLRDFQLSCWISQLNYLEAERVPSSEEKLPVELAPALVEAKQFLFAVRCYLHYFSGRDSNRLDFDLQETVAHAGSGTAFRRVEGAAEWMRDYYRHIRSVHRLALRLMEESASARSSLFSVVRDRWSRFSNDDFSVAHGRIFFRHTQRIDVDPAIGLRLFRFVGRHGLPLSADAERTIEAALPALREYFSSGVRLWPAVADLLAQPHAYQALALMRDTGALYALLPELEDIDCLVVRDFYHSYTVDEHSFRTIRNLKELHEDDNPLTARFAHVAAEVDHPERLFFALLMHDSGKSRTDGPHSQASVELAERALERLNADEGSRRSVLFLIREHLAMSAFITRRDISDPETVEEFAQLVGTVENLRALTLVTYADTSAVHPTALSSWRKQLLWQLYLSAYNRLTGQVGDRRIRPDQALPAIEALAAPPERTDLRGFLRGLPERYLRTRSPEEIRRHFDLSRELATKAAAVAVERVESLYEVTVLAYDKPFLFASLCGALAGFGLNIERAEACANESGVIVDVFHVAVSASRGGGELDGHDLQQLRRMLRLAVEGRESVPDLLKRRRRFGAPRGRVPIEPDVSYDNQISSRATVFHVIAEDRIGLLYDLTSAFSQQGCDIEVVLIETQGRKAIDVFYVVGPEGKLDESLCGSLRRELAGVCRAKAA